MKFFTSVSLVLGIFVSLPALASFSLSSVSSIECTDADTINGIKIFFTTSDSAAQTYFRRDDNIPYDYGNQLSPFGDAQSGTLKMVNSPDSQNSQIVLEDQWDENNMVRLVLTHKRDNAYSALLSGPVETATGWSSVTNHRLNCVLNF